MGLKKKLAAATLAAGALMGIGIPAAQAACYYAAPKYDSHVTYYNCRGPYVHNAYSSTRRYDCWADYDWYAETFWGYKDGWRVLYVGKTCTA